MVLQEILIHVHHHRQKEIYTTRVVQEFSNANEDHTIIRTPTKDLKNLLYYLIPPPPFPFHFLERGHNFFLPHMHYPCVKYAVVLYNFVRDNTEEY